MDRLAQESNFPSALLVGICGSLASFIVKSHSQIQDCEADFLIPLPQVLGGLTARVTPVPIPNTEVKPRRADDTARVTARERRSPPGLNSKKAPSNRSLFYFGWTRVLISRLVRGSLVHKFQATIYKIWMLPYVDVPEEIGRGLEKESRMKKHIPVVATANGRSARTTLTPAGGGRYRLQFNATLRKAARADVGDLVGVELRLDRETRELPLPDEIAEALKSGPKARKAFQQMGPATRRQFILYFDKAKSPAVRQKRLARLIEILLERALLGSPAKKAFKR